MSETTERSPQHLERGLGALDAATIVVGSMIGSGIFITSAESTRLVGAPGWLLAAWALAGLLTVTGALCCAELAAMMPRAGGQYVFLREAYGPAPGFLFGWSLFLVIQTGTIAAVAVAFARFTGVLVPWVSSGNYVVEPLRLTEGYALSLSTEQLVAVCLILLLTFTNTLGLKLGKLIQNTFTFTKTAALAGLIVVGLGLGWSRASAAYTSDWWNPWANGWTPQAAQPGLEAAGALALVMLLGRAMTGPLFAQSAWNNVTFTGSEVRDPARSLPRALLAGCAVVVGLYLLANLAYVLTLPLDVMQKPPNSIATATVSAGLGAPGVALMAAAIMVSTFGCNNGLLLAGARVTYAMACDRLFFRPAARLNSRRVPAFALAVQGLWAALLTLPRTVTAAADPATGAVKLAYGNVYTQLLEYIIPADVTFYMLMVGAVVVLRR
ncbi:MAG: amino acid permease, partial [Acidobacteria bacterium]|nr:amino acid permease [Acidobacteriota bacterium]